MNDSLKMKSADQVSAQVWHQYCSKDQDQPIRYLYAAAIASYAKECLTVAIALCVDQGQIRLAQEIRDLKDGL